MDTFSGVLRIYFGREIEYKSVEWCGILEGRLLQKDKTIDIMHYLKNKCYDRWYISIASNTLHALIYTRKLYGEKEKGRSRRITR